MAKNPHYFSHLAHVEVLTTNLQRAKEQVDAIQAQLNDIIAMKKLL